MDDFVPFIPTTPCLAVPLLILLRAFLVHSKIDSINMVYSAKSMNDEIYEWSCYHPDPFDRRP